MCVRYVVYDVTILQYVYLQSLYLQSLYLRYDWETFDTWIHSKTTCTHKWFSSRIINTSEKSRLVYGYHAHVYALKTKVLLFLEIQSLILTNMLYVAIMSSNTQLKCKHPTQIPVEFSHVLWHLGLFCR